MADVNFYLRDNLSPKATGVMMFLSYGGKRIKIATVDKIHPKYWDNENQRSKQTKAFPTYPEYNQRLKDLSNIALDTYRKYLNDNGQQKPLPETIKKLIKAELIEKVEPEQVSTYTLVTFADHIVQEIKSGRRLTLRGKPLSNSIYKIFKTHAVVLRAYQDTKRKPILFEDCTLEFYHDFLAFLTTSRKYSTNTIGKHIRTLKAILNDATYLGLNSRTDFKRFTAMSESIDNIYLTPEELNALYVLDLKNKTRLERVRDLFLVGCWTGLRFSDFSTITTKNLKGDFIEIKTQKTGKDVVIPIHPTVRAIMAKYENITDNSLPEAMSNQKMNEYLKELGEEAKLNEVIQKERTTAGVSIAKSHKKYELITTHTARRSFATNMYNMGVPSLTIMGITGHKTESNFMKYIKITPKEHAIKLRDLWHRDHLKVV